VGRWLLLAALAVAVCATAGGAGGAGSSLRLVQVARLDSPVLVAAPGSETSRIYVVEQAGTIRVIEKGRLLPRPFLDIRSRVLSGGEQGLLGLAFAPDYAKSRTFVVDYTDRQGNTVVARYRSKNGRAVTSSGRQLLLVEQPYGNHNGGMVAYGPDGLVYVGTGDGGSGGDPENHAQDIDSPLGKLLRLDPRNPGQAPVVVAIGLRNPWRFSFDRRLKTLWIGDVGQGSVEEIDRVAWPLRGLLNFGWDVYEGRASFEDKALGPGRLVQPVTQYSHASGCSVTGGYVYRGRALPAARGRYFYGDYCTGTVWSLRMARGKAQVRREPFRVESLAGFGEDARGELYLASLDGPVYRLAG
jgi:glucose/arabinose dehydrogenase